MRLLVIEDEHKIANALKKALQREHYAVDVSYDGDDGWAMASTEPYDAMIIDRMLPGDYDGLAIVRELRASGNHTPVLLLTALGSVGDKTTGLDTGAGSYTTAHGIGQIWSTNHDSLTRGFIRGGHWNNGVSAGILTLSPNGNPSLGYTNVGFRAAQTP